MLKAPEPDQIVWENIEVPFRQKLYLRIRTNTITFVLVVLCFIIILQASIYKSLFSDQIPSELLCGTTIPAVYANGSNSDNFELVRPPDSQQASYDTQCQQYVPGSFYAVYSTSGDFGDPAVTYNVTACSTLGECPIYGANKYCPCVTLDSKTACQNAYCTTIGATSTSCDTFEAGDIGESLSLSASPS